MTSSVYNRDGGLKQFYLACGYYQQATNGDQSVSLSMTGRQYRIYIVDAKETTTQVFRFLKDARAAYNAAAFRIRNS